MTANKAAIFLLVLYFFGIGMIVGGYMQYNRDYPTQPDYTMTPEQYQGYLDTVSKANPVTQSAPSTPQPSSVIPIGNMRASASTNPIPNPKIPPQSATQPTTSVFPTPRLQIIATPLPDLQIVLNAQDYALYHDKCVALGNILGMSQADINNTQSGHWIACFALETNKIRELINSYIPRDMYNKYEALLATW